MERIVIIGECPIDAEDAKKYVNGLCSRANEAEINILDISGISSRNTVESVDGAFIHRYKHIGSDQESTMQLAKTIARDIVALGPVKCILTTQHSYISRTVQNIVKSYGICCTELH